MIIIVYYTSFVPANVNTEVSTDGARVALSLKDKHSTAH